MRIEKIIWFRITSNGTKALWLALAAGEEESSCWVSELEAMGNWN